MVVALILEFTSCQSHLLAPYFNILVLIFNRVWFGALRESNPDAYVFLHFWGVILPLFYFFGDNLIYFVFLAVLFFSIVFLLGRIIRVLLSNAMLFITIAFPLYVISLFSLTFIFFGLVPILNLIILRFTASLLLSFVYLFFVFLVFCFSASKEYSFPEIGKRYLPITLWCFLLASIMNLTTMVSGGFSSFILFLGLYNYSFLKEFFKDTGSPHILKSRLIGNILRFIPGPFFALDLSLFDGGFITSFSQVIPTAPLLMAPPPVILKPEATLLSHTRPNAGLNCPRASKPLGVYRTLMTGSATSPIHPTEGAILLESGRESLKRNNYPAYLNAITRSLYSEGFSKPRHFNEKLIVHGLHESAAHPEVYAIVPTEQLFIGEMVSVQLRAGDNYLLPNKPLFDAAGGGPLLARYLDASSLPEGVIPEDVTKTGGYFIKRFPSNIAGTFFYEYTRLDSEIEARLDYFSSNLSVFENRMLRLPSEMAVNRNLLKPKSIFLITEFAGPILKLRFGDLILLGEDGKVLGLVEAKSITMRKDEGVFDENMFDALFGHSIDNTYNPCVDNFNVCARDEKGARFLGKDLLTKRITKVYAEEVLENPSVAPRLSEQLYAGEQLICDPKKREEVKIHALGKVTSKLEKTDL